MELLNEVFGVESIDQALVFTRTKRSADKCSSYLHTLGFSVAALHGDKSQSVRSKTLEKFKNGKTKILVATDIAARGLDIKELPFVINLELPNVPEDYVHRIGRTGRAGNDGVAISLVCVDEFKFLIDIEKLIDKKLIRESFSGFEADLRVKPQPIRRGQNMNKSSERDDRNGNKIDKKERKPREFNSDKKDESKREYRRDGVKSEFSKDKKEFSKNSRAKDSNSSFDGEAKREFKFKKDDKNLARKRNLSAIKNLLMTKTKNLAAKRNLALIKSLEVVTKVLMKNILVINLARKRNLEVTNQTEAINLLKTLQSQELQADHANHNLIKNPLQNRYFIAI
ncbi:helicase-related protein [Campylobacter fetus]|uniref:helicase-related protein n=1 Tax=Campylobacter fetus TaxID=196 RepID=UPI000AB6CE4D|nr:helicase-related protein [Campylobacter fetus]WNY78948.1 hypothetical protein NL684_03865 [Campylobacter fetus subsp. fetus]WNY80710.1 hypothetical protein NL677_03875 [Campylobacter fetus subsp. fetus]